MSRIRYLKPDFFTDEDLAELPFETRLTFAGLWGHADKAGRLEDRPRFLKAMIFPYDNVDMEKQLDVLCKEKANGKPFILRYQNGCLNLIQILNWDKHQRPHHTEKESVFPPPPQTPPPKIKEKGMGMEKQLNAGTELKNGKSTVRKRLKKTTLYNCQFFQRFWTTYPKKVGKGKAWQYWLRIEPKPDDEITKKMEHNVSVMKKSKQWKNPQYIPNPATWLNERRWEDEPNGNTGNGRKDLTSLF